MSTQPTPAPEPEKCPHSHLHVNFLKKIGRAVEEAGEDTVQAAIAIALSNYGAFSED